MRLPTRGSSVRKLLPPRAAQAFEHPARILGGQAAHFVDLRELFGREFSFVASMLSWS